MSKLLPLKPKTTRPPLKTPRTTKATTTNLARPEAVVEEAEEEVAEAVEAEADQEAEVTEAEEASEDQEEESQKAKSTKEEETQSAPSSSTTLSIPPLGNI